MDGMPFVGRASSSADHLYVATGFNAWGITNGTAAGMILCDLISGRDNPWAQVFDATRVKPLAGAKSFISENIGTGAELVGGYLKGERRSLDELSAGEAAIVKLNGERTAVFRDERGRPPCGLRGVHSHGMRAGLECGRPDLGLLVPRLPLRPGRHRASRSCDDRLGTNSRLLTEQEAGFDAAPAPSLPCGQTDLRTPKRIS